MEFSDLIISVLYGSWLAICLFAWIWAIIDILFGNYGISTLIRLALVLFLPEIGIILHYLTRSRKRKQKQLHNGILQ